MIHNFSLLLIVLFSVYSYVLAQSIPSKQKLQHINKEQTTKFPSTAIIQSTQFTFENHNPLDLGTDNQLFDSKKSPKQKRKLQGLPNEAPKSFDWRQKIRFHVLNSLGSCPNFWAYSTTGFFEAISQIQDPSITQINFSQDYLIRCDKGNNNSCNNGFLNTAMDFLLTKGGLPQQQKVENIILTNQNANICQDQVLYMLKQTNNARLTYFNLGNQEKIKELLLKNPLNIKICSKDLVKYYPSSSKEGKRVLKCSPQNNIVDHSVLLVGYTETEWIILNEWGPFWGLNGFAYISRNSDDDCCIGAQIHTISPKSQKCPLANCISCINQIYCTKCSSKYYLTYNFGLLTQECTKCAHQNCESCLDYSGTCTNCLTGFSYFSEQKKCLIATISYCTFMSMDLCFQCSQGFILSKNYLECYQNCPLKNCKACPNSLCSQCVAGFYLANYTDASQSCQKNPCTVQNCRLCDKNGKCIECSDYFLLNDLKKCDPVCNMEGCLICNQDQSKCSLCASGKSFNFWTGLCQTHSFENCFSFGYLQQLGLKCDQCKQNYIFNSNYTQCIQKCDVINCIKCDFKDLTDCYECQTGYFLRKVNGGSQCQKNPCKAGIANCLLCDKNGNCLKCAANDFIFNLTSLKCERGCNVANCEKCDPERSDLCDTCKAGYSSLSDIYCYIKNDQKCVLWDQSSTSSPKACTYCETNYQAVNGICKPGCKDKFCDICEIETLDICKKCLDGYQFTSSTEVKNCKFNVPTMLFCDLISTNQTYCFKCSRGYFFLKQSQTWGCYKVNTTTPNCFTWDSTGKCLECNTFYKLNSSKLCQKVCKIAGCLACSKNGMYCDQCDEGLSINIETKVCQVFNFSNCLSYQKGINSVNVCVKCVSGTIFNRNLTKCFQECDTVNCAKCQTNNKAICIACESGFYVKTFKNVTECAPYLCEVGNCSACDDRGNCVACINANFELDSANNQCRLSCKVTSCQQCTENLLVCLKCKGQYELYNNVCYLPSPQHCAVWRLGEDSVTRIGCTKCEPKYTLFFIVKEMEPKCKMDCTDTYCEVCKTDKQNCDKCLDGFERVQIQGNKYKCNKIVTRIKDCQLGSYNQSNCFYCRKYYFFNSTSKKCQPYKKNCKTNCQMCSPKQFYDPKCHCGQSFIFFTDTARCVTNPLSSNYCIQVQSGMNSSSLCSDCIAGFQPSENRLYCEKYCEVENCETCVKDSNTQCMNCLRGFYKKKWDFCKICDVQNCAECFEENSCLMCQDGFELIKNSTSFVVTCSKKVCPNNMIYRNQNCTCLAGTYQKDQQCYKCNSFTPNCTKCTNSTCNQCAQQFYLSQNSCLACSSRCLKCTDLLNCQQCEPRYYFSSLKMRCIESALSSYAYFQDGSAITQCPNKCVNCSSSGKCSKCEPSYRADQSSGICVKCEKNCLSCEIDSKNGNAFVCASCVSDYILVDNGCVKCTENCLLCDKLTEECAKCKEGFYLSNQNKCLPCKKNCIKCTSQFDCSQCSTGFSLRQEESQCRECLVDSISCNSSSLIESILKCMDGFYVNVTNCTFCPSNCLQCNSSTNCTICEVGYRLTNNLCYSDCKEECFSCDPNDVNKCLMCFSGYVLDTKNFTCLIDLSCNSNSNCVNCPLKYFLSNKKCQKCKNPSNQCVRCSLQNPQLCLQCSLGYHLQSDTKQPCKLCPNGCKYCQSESYCDVCNQGFFINKSLDDSQLCKQCSSQCKTCQSFTGRCLTCAEGFQYIQAKDSCLTTERVGLWIKLNLNFSDCVDKFPIIKNALLSEILQNKQTSRDLIIKSIRQGSTIIDLQISTPKNQNTTSFISFISTKIASKNTLSGFGIIEYSKLSSVNNKEEVPKNSPVAPVEGGSSNRGALIAVSVIASVLFIILVIVIIFLIRKKKAENIGQGSQRNVISEGIESEKISTEQKIKQNRVMNPQITQDYRGFEDKNLSQKNNLPERNRSIKSRAKMSPYEKKKEVLDNIESAKQIHKNSEYFNDT